MTKAEKNEIVLLEKELTELLGKQNGTRRKRPCTGKFAGHNDYGLEFEDGSSFYIGLDMKGYLRNLRDQTAGYRFFRDNYGALKERVRMIVERDNRQAVKLGLAQIEFVDLELITEPRDSYAFWVQLVYRFCGVELRYKETGLFYACLGHGTEEYFEKHINRSDEELGLLRHLGKENYTAILLGCLMKR